MTNFERIGVNYQFDANSIEEANRAFSYSCDCCCSKGRYADCNRCAIAYNHDLVVAYFNDKDKKQIIIPINKKLSTRENDNNVYRLHNK